MEKQMSDTKGTEVSFPIILSSVKEKEEDSNNSLFKNDSLSSDQPSKPPALPSKAKMNPNPPQIDQIKRFLKRGDALNTITLRKLNDDKQIHELVKNDRSSASLYKNSRHIDFISAENPKQKEIKRIYLSNGKVKPKFFFKGPTIRSTKLSQQVQTETLQPNYTIDSRRDLFIQYSQYPPFNLQNLNHMSYNTLDVITEEQKKKAQKAQQSMKLQEDAEQNALLPPRERKGGVGRAKAVSGRNSANNYLETISKLQFSFHSGINRFPNRYREYQQQQTIFNKTIDPKPFPPLRSTLNNFAQPQSPHKTSRNTMNDLTIQTQQSHIAKFSIQRQVNLPQNKTKSIQTEYNNKDIIIPFVNLTCEQLNTKQQTSMIAEISENQQYSHSQISKINPSKNTDVLASLAPLTHQQRASSPERHERNTKKSILIQVPSEHQLKVGELEQPITKTFHPIRQNFGSNELQWMKNNYRPKNQLLQNINPQNLQIKKYKNGVYFGELDLEGKKSGKGIIFYFSGKIYEGELKSDIKHGKGYQCYPDGSKYSGQFSNGTKQGRGVFEWSNGEIYEGQWESGKKSGSGMWKGANGQSYIGEWKNGKVQGFGVYIMANGSRYEGQFRNSLKHGVGTERFSNGETYVGSYQKNRPNGQGQYYWANGDYYKGQFSNGLRHGQGYFKQGKSSIQYKGQYKNDKKCGYGQVNYGNQLVYIGNFQNNLRHGYGEMTEKGLSKYKGYWINDRQVDQFYKNGISPPKIQEKKGGNRQNNTVNNRKPNPTIKKLTKTGVHPIIEDDMERQQSLPRMFPKVQNAASNPRERTLSQLTSPQCTHEYKRSCGCNKKH